MLLVYIAIAYVLYLRFRKQRSPNILSQPSWDNNNDEMFARTFLSSLPKEYIVLNNLLLNAGGVTSQIDNIVISPYGIFVIETKSYKGRVHGVINRPKWRCYYGFGKRQKYYEFQNPLFQNHGHIKTLSRILQGNSAKAMVSIISFTNPEFLAKRGEEQKYEHVITSNNINECILNYKKSILSTDTVNYIYSKLASNNIQSAENLQKHIESIRMRIPETA